MLEDVVYYVEPLSTADPSLTSVHYVIVADSLRAANSSCGKLTQWRPDQIAALTFFEDELEYTSTLISLTKLNFVPIGTIFSFWGELLEGVCGAQPLSGLLRSLRVGSVVSSPISSSGAEPRQQANFLTFCVLRISSAWWHSKATFFETWHQL